MIASAVFARYARALVDVALEKGIEPAVSADLRTWRDIFDAVPDLLQVFHSPAVSREVKLRILKELFRLHPVSRETENFLRIALEHNRLRYFREIHDYYLRAVNSRKGIVAAEVTASGPIGAADSARLRAALERATGSTVNLAFETDPELLGGLVVRIGSTVYDGSVRRQLDEMKRRLSER